jgi:glycerophosphoryl diester phosphodiesterase
VIGHRGAPVAAPPNTLEGLMAAVAAGADLVEFDVGVGLLLGHPGQTPSSRPPRLDEALELLAREPIGLHIDLKHPGIEDDVARTVREHGLAGRAAVSSTSAGALARLAAAAPELTRLIGYPRDRAHVSGLPWPAPLERSVAALARRLVPLRVPALLRRGTPGGLALHHTLVSAAVVAQVHARGVALVAWTVNQPQRVAALAGLGVDAIVSDDPGMAREVVGTLESR